MQLSRKLSKVHNRVNSLREEIASEEGSGNFNLRQRRIIERCVLQIQVEAELFIRNFILDCATGRYSCASGVVHSPMSHQFNRRETAHHYLIQNRKTRREPHWAIPKDAIDAAKILNLSNFSHISAELGITPWEVDDLRYVRNFIAHQSKESAIKLRSVGLASAKDPIDPVAIVVAPSPMGGKNYERWAGFINGLSTRLVT